MKPAVQSDAEARALMRCPVCKAGEGYSRMRHHDWRCRRCGTTWILGGEILESPLQVAWVKRIGEAKAKPAKPALAKKEVHSDGDGK